MDNLVSVIIPTHNRASLLERAVKSVINQRYSNIEVIVVSDGSSDCTSEEMKRMEKKYSMVRFFEYFPAKGGNYARNYGIKKAKGEYIAFLDDDDEWYNDKILKQMEIMKDDPTIGLVYTGTNIIYENEKVTYNFVPKLYGDMSKKILLDNYIGTTSTVLIRRTILMKTELFDLELKSLQDFELWIRVCQLTKVGVVSEPLVHYYNYTGNKQVSSLTQKYKDSFEYINQKHSNLFNKLTDEEKKKKKENELFLLGNKAMRNGDSRTARRYMCGILKINFNLKAIIYILFSFFGFKFILKMRKRKN